MKILLGQGRASFFSSSVLSWTAATRSLTMFAGDARLFPKAAFRASPIFLSLGEVGNKITIKTQCRQPNNYS